MTPTPPQMRLWTPHGFREDDWAHGADADALQANGRFILPLAVVAAIDARQRAGVRERLGVVLAPSEPVDALVALLDDLALVALAFPAFNDGRSFSKATLLRERHGYRGPLRATGQVLPDQLPHMLRLGFDEFEVSHPVLIKRLEQGRIGGIPWYYQPAAGDAGTAEVAPQEYSWRRRRGS